jgi:hypothetical protein
MGVGGEIITPHDAIHVPLDIQKMTDVNRTCMRHMHGHSAQPALTLWMFLVNTAQDRKLSSNSTLQLHCKQPDVKMVTYYSVNKVLLSIRSLRT